MYMYNKLFTQPVAETFCTVLMVFFFNLYIRSKREWTQSGTSYTS